MKKEKKSQAQIKIRYEPDRMIFEVEGKEFFLNKETASFLFGRNVEIQFEALQGKDEDLGELATLENYVTVIRLMKKGLNLDHAALFLGYPQEKVRNFIGIVQRRKGYYDPNDFKKEMDRQANAEDYVKRKSTGRERPGEEPGRAFIDLLILRNDLRKGLKNKQIAELFEVDEKDFDKFMEKNQKYLDLLI